VGIWRGCCEAVMWGGQSAALACSTCRRASCVSPLRCTFSCSPSLSPTYASATAPAVAMLDAAAPAGLCNALSGTVAWSDEPDTVDLDGDRGVGTQVDSVGRRKGKRQDQRYPRPSV